MPWKEVKTASVEIKGKQYTIKLTTTGQNLLIEIYEMLDGRIFFGYRYAYELIKNLMELNKEILGGRKPKKRSVDFTKDKKIELRAVESHGQNFIEVSRKKSETGGLTWINEKDYRTGMLRLIRLPASKELVNLINTVEEYVKMIEEDKIKDPAKTTSLYGVYFPGWMATHDRSIIAFKMWYDSDETECFIRLDENIKKKDDPVKIERAEVANDAKEMGITFLPEKRGDDGWISVDEDTIDDLDEDLIVHYDWEHRRDWVLNYNNIPIYMEEYRRDKKLKFYVALAYPPRERTNHNYYDNTKSNKISDVIKKIEKYGLSHPKPYFIYDTLGQFGRKIEKSHEALTIQCTQISPVWYKDNIKIVERACYPENKGEKVPKIKQTISYFVVAWHHDFDIAITTIRKTGVGPAEIGDYWTTSKFGVFPFTQEGVKSFRDSIIKQFKTGVVEDRNKNLIPRKRSWN